MAQEISDELSGEFEVPVDWTPENGFAAAEGTTSKRIYPRPGFGKCYYFSGLCKRLHA